MIHLLYGSDTYRSREKLHEMIADCQSSDSNRRADVDMHRIDAEEDDISRIRPLLETGSLFAKKKLVVIERLCASGRDFDEIAPFFKRIKTDADTLVIVWEGDLGKEGEKRLVEMRPLADAVLEFKPLAPAQLRKWIVGEAKKRDIRIGPADLEHLVSLGGNLWATVNELEKYAVRPEPETHASAARPVSIFEFGDLFFTSPRAALAALPRLLASGQDEFRLYAYLAGYCRTLLIVQAYGERREPVPGHHKIAPFVASKGKTIVQSIPAPELRAMLQNFFAEDYKIKTGVSTPRDSLVRIVLTRQRS